jgi:small GTP-binding protein
MIAHRFDFTLKIIIIGDSGVGKTSILLRYVRGVFDPETQMTLGVEFMTKTIEAKNHRIQLQLWDTSGHELFRSVTRAYFRGSAGAFLVFDISNRDSFDHIDRSFHDVKELARSDVVAVLMGNKSDKADEREVTREEAEQFAKERQMKYFETSAKTGSHVGEAVIACVEVIEKYIADGVYDVRPDPQDAPLLLEETTEKSSCPC